MSDTSDIIHMVVGMNAAQHEVISPLMDRGYPAIRQGQFDDELIVLDHTSGVITEHFVGADGSMQSFILIGDDWRELPDDWQNTPRNELQPRGEGL